MLTKVIKLFGYSYFLRINASIFRRNCSPPVSGGGSGRRQKAPGLRP